MAVKKKYKKNTKRDRSVHKNEHSFKKGNRIWEMRSKHGREAMFTDPVKLREACFDYFKMVDDNPWYKVDYKSGIKVKIPTVMPYTIEGLCLFLGVSSHYWRDFRNSVTGRKPEFASVIQEVDNTMRNQKFSGASAGYFNANIISRDLGLIDRQDITSGGGEIKAPVVNVYTGNAPKLSGSEEEIEDKTR